MRSHLFAKKGAEHGGKYVVCMRLPMGNNFHNFSFLHRLMSINFRSLATEF